MAGPLGALWSSLRSTRTERQSLGGDPDHERKVLLANYYETLARAGLGGDRARAWPIERAISEGYERVVWVFRCVNRIAGDSSTLPIVVMSGDREEERHPLALLLNDGQANDLETGVQLRKRLSSQVLLSKRGAFVEATLSRGGTPLAYDLLPPGRTRPVPGTEPDPVTGRVKAIDHYELTLRDGGHKDLDPDTVRWFRDPHPVDPYSGVTPLEAIGLSIELDWFARLFNVSLLRNDGRPGGVLAVRGTGERGGDVDERALDRIESRFGKGPLEAGKVSVITGELTYTDLSGNARDMSYAQLARNAKTEIMGGFGVGDSVLGQSGEKTYANADSEQEHYWLKVMPEHNGLIVTGFNRDSADALRVLHDITEVPALQRIKEKLLDRAAAEVDKGLRSPWSYLVLAGREEEAEETPELRAFYMPTGRDVIPATEADREALAPAPAPTPPPSQEPGTGEQQPGQAGQEDGQAPPAPGEPAAPPTPPANAPPAAPAAPAPAVATKALPVEHPHLQAVPDLPPQPARVTITREEKAAPGELVASDPDQGAWQALEAAIAAALAELGAHWVERTAARLTSPKARKGTRHWQPEYDVDTRLGRKALDAPRAVDEEQWQQDAEAAVTPLVEAAAAAAALALAADLAPGVPLRDVPGVIAGTVREVVALVGGSALRQARALTDAINGRDQAGQPMDTIVEAVRARGGQLANWARGLATHAASATVDSARLAAVERLAADGVVSDVEQQWATQRDDRVRATHKAANRQRRALGVPFLVGGAMLRYPADPEGPLQETANCRCFVRHRAKATGRFVARPAGATG